jgi:hypothetical protein
MSVALLDLRQDGVVHLCKQKTPGRSHRATNRGLGTDIT